MLLITSPAVNEFQWLPTSDSHSCARCNAAMQQPAFRDSGDALTFRSIALAEGLQTTANPKPRQKKVGKIMSTNTIGMALPAAAERSQAGGFLKRMASAFMRHQEAKAARYVRPYMARLSDADLMRLGHSPEEIAVIRAECRPPLAWI